MPTPIPEGFLMATTEWLIGGARSAFTVTGHDHTAAAHTPDVMAALIYTGFVENFTPELSLGVSLISTHVELGDGTVGDHYAVTVGSEVGSASTSNTAYLLDKKTGLVGRRNHGSMFLPGVVEDLVDDLGNVEAGQRADLQVAADGFMAHLEDQFLPMVLLHSQYRNSNGVLVPPDVADVPAPTLVTSLQVDPVVATQRRRMR